MKKVTILAMLFAIIPLVIHTQARAEEKYSRPKVAIMPFELNAAADLAYLPAGVEAMLASRLGSRGGVAVIDRQAVRKAMDDSGGADPAVIGSAVGAELVLKGSITAMGNLISLDLRAVRVIGEAADERFYATANSPGEVIAAIDQLVVEVGRNMFKGGLKQSGSEVRFGPVGPAQVEPPKEEKGAQGSGGDQALHPDRLFREAAPVAPAIPPIGAVAASAAGLPGRPEMISRSQSLDLEMQDLDVGDVFGDGSQVVIMADEHQLHAYRQEGNKLVEAGKIPAPPKFARVVALNLADLNGNGRAEIYISTISDNTPYSYIVEWDGTGFATLSEKQPWHLRPVNLPGRGLVLLGQRADADRPVREGLYVLTLADGKLVAGEKLALPDAVNLFEFIMADFNGDSQAEVAAVDDGGVLSLYGADGEVLWRGSDTYAHTVRYIGKSAGAVSEKTNRNVPSRLIAADVNGDGRPELVVMKNPSGVAALLKTIGSFTGSSVQFLTWNGISFVDVWNTGEIGSYLVDYQLIMTPAGTPSRLYLGLITKKSGLTFGDYRSVLAVYPLAAVTR
jgi:TolB-like protein